MYICRIFAPFRYVHVRIMIAVYASPKLSIAFGRLRVGICV